MLYNYKNKILLVIVLAIAMFSCKKILEPDVIDSPTGRNAFKTAQDVNNGIGAAYSFLRTALPNKIFLFGDVRAYNFSSLSFTTNVRPETSIPENDYNALINNGGGNWSDFYRTIAQCNLLLEVIPTISNYDNATKRRHIGEVSFIRALTYFYLVRFWGDVPINLSSVNIGTIARSPQAEVYKLVKSDLDKAIANLSLLYSADDKAVRATKGAAWAIKAHLMAWQQDYSACEKLCDSVIRFGNYSLVKDTTNNNLVKIFVGKSPEGIFELNYDYLQNEVEKNLVYNRTLGRPWYKDVSDGGGGTEKFLLSPTTEQMDAMFKPGAKDARRFSWFIKDYFANSVTIGKETYNGAKNRYYFGKYRTLAQNADTTSQKINESNIIITRLADIILLRAEALASNTVNRPAEAVTLLNEVRKRAFAAAYTGGGDLQDTILLERKKELIGEGHFFFDLVRTRKMNKYSLITESDWYSGGAWLLPINQSIIAESNFTITQNDYWK
ncbi:RagB/SusD family nutrient uptake outer membrane protein [Pedobacter endophyticus]|uniref:RagB/SusD family nutrient uptake outer membrane protein n=1 Tax=Pedobacter endophyticus TaxID=2789740 RepID=A0A7S9L293_9SPHI|nr:RagB/SusD family nutrient uptake outer membrane protein [Pedobacter endophyticus]QPH41161.1 RagB/SusD family nutrient uptake outer membrane protein [Pedobacter endophyticus]